MNHIIRRHDQDYPSFSFQKPKVFGKNILLLRFLLKTEAKRFFKQNFSTYIKDYLKFECKMTKKCLKYS